MATKHHRLRNTLLIILGVIIGLVILVIVFISPIVKYLVEKYDVQYTGREIEMDYAYVNPFSGYLHLDDIQIFEHKSDSVFFYASGISVHFSLLKMLSKEYDITGLELDAPNIRVVESKKGKFNFTDLIEKFAGDTTKTEQDTTPVRFNLVNINIHDGFVHYEERMTPVDYKVKNISIESSGLRWDNDTIATTFSFESGIGSGEISGNIVMNMKSNDYKLVLKVKDMDTKLQEQYLKDLANYGSLRALYNADIKATGNFNDAQDVDASGTINISDFHFGKSRKEDFASFENFNLKINRINPKKKIYLVDSLSLVRPYFRFEQYDELNNIETMFGSGGANVKKIAEDKEKYNLVIELSRYVRLLAKNFFKSDYKVNRLAVYAGNFKYNDYAISEKFSIAANPFYLIADSIHTSKKRVLLKMYTGIKPYGDLNVRLSINPNDSSDFKLTYNLEKLNATVLNPYLINFTSFPLDRGSIGFKGETNVMNGKVRSYNRLLIIDPRITQRVKNKDNSWLPLKFMMFFVRERGNAIDYEVPISGDLNNPKFHIRDVILDIISNIFVKPPTTLYRSEVKAIENTIEKNLAFNWQMGATLLMPDQEKFVQRVAEFLKENPNASLVIQPVQYKEKELEYLTLFEAKKVYYLKVNKKANAAFTPDDSTAVSKMSAKDSAFVKFLNKQVKNRLLFTVQEKSKAFIGAGNIDKKFKQLVEKRTQTFKQYFVADNLLARLTIKENKNDIPFTGFSYYKIAYNGQVPENIQNAFAKLNEFDNEEPRVKLKEERKKTRRFLNFRKKQ